MTTNLLACRLSREDDIEMRPLFRTKYFSSIPNNAFNMDFIIQQPVKCFNVGDIFNSPYHFMKPNPLNAARRKTKFATHYHCVDICQASACRAQEHILVIFSQDLLTTELVDNKRC